MCPSREHSWYCGEHVYTNVGDKKSEWVSSFQQRYEIAQP